MSEVEMGLALGWTEGAYLFREQGSRDQEVGALLKGAGPHIAQVSKDSKSSSLPAIRDWTAP